MFSIKLRNDSINTNSAASACLKCDLDPSHVSANIGFSDKILFLNVSEFSVKTDYSSHTTAVCQRKSTEKFYPLFFGS